MPSVLSDDDKEIVRRMVPKASNKIQAVAVARLYIAYPNRSKWTDTGLQGAVVLCNDLIGNTYWLKLVDISSSGRGVIWDQEIYDQWNYSQDRIFFHTFETEQYLAGLSFADDKEAKAFLKKMVDREKNASKATKATPFGGASQSSGGQRHGLLGGFFSGHRHSSAPTMQPTPPDSPTAYLPPRQSDRLSVGSALNGSRQISEFAKLDAIDPNWRETWGDDLKNMGITDHLIRDNQDFIANYIQEQQATAAAATSPVAPAPIVAELNGTETQRGKAPPPPPPPQAALRKDSDISISPSMSSGRGAPPAPPPSRRAKADTVQREPTPPRDPSPPKGPPPPKFAAPPPLPDAGKFANSNNLSSRNNRPHASSVSNPGPPPPPRPPKTPNEDPEPADIRTGYGVPPPFTGQRVQAPPPTPARGPVPPPPPARNTPARDIPSSHAHAIPPANVAPPPLPPKTPNAPSSAAPSLPPSSSRPVPPPPARDSGPPPPPARANLPPLPPPLPASNARPAPSTGPPVAPPLPPSTGAASPPPPPPPPSSSGPPPPPPPPNRDSGYVSGVPALPQSTGGREDVLAGIKEAGGIKALKKVDRTQIRDRSAAMISGGSDTGPHGSGLPPAGVSSPTSGGGGLADALAVALSKRKQKVSASDDEAEEDEW